MSGKAGQLAKGPPSDRSKSSAPDTFTVLTDKEKGELVRRAAVLTNKTISDVFMWCFLRSWEDYVRENKLTELKLRPGRRIRLPR